MHEGKKYSAIEWKKFHMGRRPINLVYTRTDNSTLVSVTTKKKINQFSVTHPNLLNKLFLHLPTYLPYRIVTTRISVTNFFAKSPHKELITIFPAKL